MVKIACRVGNGVKLRLFNQPKDGVPTQDGLPVLVPGPASRQAGVQNSENTDVVVSEIDSEWWAKWVAQNAGHNPLFDLGYIYALDDGPPRADKVTSVGEPAPEA